MNDPKINKISSLRWGLLYLLCIPLFACIYYFFIPGDFYHSTAQFEKQNIDEEKGSVIRDLNSLIKIYCQNTFSNEDTVVKGYTVSLRNSSCENLQLLKDKVQFTIKYYARSLAAKYNSNFEFISVDSFTTFYLFDVQVSYKSNGEVAQRGKNTERFYSNDLFYDTILASTPINISWFFPSSSYVKSNINGTSPMANQIFITKTILDKITNLKNSIDGFPYRTKGSFWRMFYLSSITITTVGFGDIVPITTTARILVSLEAILGIIIIGLFLNSIAIRFKK